MDLYHLLNCLALLHYVRAATGQDGMIVGCYFANWPQYRSGVANFRPGNVNTTLCTHIHYYYAQINSSTNDIQTIEPNEPGYYFSVTDLKGVNAEIKVLLTVGGAGVSINSWQEVSEDSRIGVFCQNVLASLRHYNFDGVELDWKSAPSNNSYIKVVQAMRSAIDEEMIPDGKEKLLLSASVPAEKGKELLFAPPALAAATDYITVTAYDFYGAWSATLGHHCPLYPSDTEPPDSYKSQHEAVESWLEAGVPHKKLVLGIASYGRTQKMKSSDLHSPGDPADNSLPTVNGPLTRASGSYTTFELCTKADNGWTEVWMDDSRVPYVYGKETGGNLPNQLVWISHENVQSCTEKAEYVASRRLGGIIMWSLDSDDFTGSVCGQGPYPLLTVFYNVLPRPICYFGTYGPSCLTPCGQCRGSRPCDRVNGTCPGGCRPGWVGERCEEECANGFYGEECREKCNGYCKGGSCHKVTGNCTDGCDAGWLEPACEQECSDGYFGANCTEKCTGHCKENSPCDKATGDCTDGCLEGWKSAPACSTRDVCDAEFPLIPVLIAVAVFLFILMLLVIGFICWHCKTRRKVKDMQPRQQAPSS